MDGWMGGWVGQGSEVVAAHGVGACLVPHHPLAQPEIHHCVEGGNVLFWGRLPEVSKAHRGCHMLQGWRKAPA